MQTIKTSKKTTLIRVGVAFTSLAAWALIAAPQTFASWSAWSSWKAPGSVSTCHGTDDWGDPIEGYSSVSTSALQTLIATDDDGECTNQTEAQGRPQSTSTPFSQKAKTSAYPNASNAQTATATTPQNVYRHRCRVQFVDLSEDQNGIVCL